MSHSFTDTLGRNWRIALDPWLVTKVKSDTEVLLTKWGDDKFALAIKLREDCELLCNVLWAICEEQAATNGCKEQADARKTELTREFARGLGQNTLIHALDALEGGISDFFMSPAESQARMKLLEKAKQVNELMGQKALEEIAAIDAAQVVKNFTDTVSSAQPSPTKAPLLAESHSAN